MGLRWRKDGRLVCAAMTEREDGDIYFDDTQLYEMSKRGVILADPDHAENALWHWAAHIVPDWNAMRGQDTPPTREDAGHLPAGRREAQEPSSLMADG